MHALAVTNSFIGKGVQINTCKVSAWHVACVETPHGADAVLEVIIERGMRMSNERFNAMFPH